MKHFVAFLALALTLFTLPAHASVRVFDSSATQLGIYTDVQAGNGLAVAQVGGKAKFSVTAGDGTQKYDYGFLRNQITVSGSLTAAKCGSTITNDSTGGNVPLYSLPTLAPAIYGCRFTFIVNTTSGSAFLTVTPDVSSKILLVSAGTGHSVSASTQGNSVTLEAISAGWAPVGGANGTWFAN